MYPPANAKACGLVNLVTCLTASVKTLSVILSLAPFSITSWISFFVSPFLASSIANLRLIKFKGRLANFFDPVILATAFSPPAIKTPPQLTGSRAIASAANLAGLPPPLVCPYISSILPKVNNWSSKDTSGSIPASSLKLSVSAVCSPAFAAETKLFWI